MEVRDGHGEGGEVVSAFGCEDNTKEGEFGASVGCGVWRVRARGVGAGGEVGEWGEEAAVEC